MSKDTTIFPETSGSEPEEPSSAPPAPTEPTSHQLSPQAWAIIALVAVIVLGLIGGYFYNKYSNEKAARDATAAAALIEQHKKEVADAEKKGFVSAITALETFTPEKHPFLSKQEGELLAMRQADGTRAVVVIGEDDKGKQFIAGLAYQTGLTPPKTLVYAMDPEVQEYRFAATLAIPFRHPAEQDVFYGDVLAAIKQFRLERLPAKGGAK